MTVQKVVVHTDVFLEHLCSGQSPSVLRVALSTYFCYTTVFQAIELFSFAKTEAEFKAVEDAMASVKLLGLNPKNARRYGMLLGEDRKRDRLALLIAGLCLESKLPLLTNRRKEFAGFRGLQLIPASGLDAGGDRTK